MELRGPGGDEEPLVIRAFVQASRGERDEIDPSIFRYKPEEVVDGDLAEWIGAVYALLGDRQPALAWLRLPSNSETITIRGFSGIRIGTS